MEFSRLSIEGMPVSKRKIKPLIEQGLVMGYDDVRLPTLRGLKKRGFVPDAIKQFVFSQGISKTESTVSFSLLEADNRKILDSVTRRYFFVEKPIKLIVKNAPILEKQIRFHPTNENLGTRIIKTNDEFYIPKSDFDNLIIGDIFRLKDLYNVNITDKNKIIKGKYVSDELIKDSAKIQWTTNNYIQMDIFVPGFLYKDGKYNSNSLKKVAGFAEEAVTKLKSGTIVQFERFGFVRIEQEDKKIFGFFTHK
jgi:glutamyl-tRNA synthetase